MKIGVCLKQVPATDTRIKINPEGTDVVLGADVKWEVNPYDEFALEAALLMKEAGQASEVILFSVGADDCEARIKDGLARGAGSAVRLHDDAFVGSDALGVARILSAAMKKADVQLVLCGKQAVDSDSSQVAPMMAEMLGWQQITSVHAMELADGVIEGKRASGGGNTDVVKATLPAVISCDKGLNTPRFASLRGIMMAKRKKIEVWGAGDLGLDATSVGANAAVTSEFSMSAPPERPSGHIIEGDAAAQAAELFRLLRDEAKVL